MRFASFDLMIYAMVDYIVKGDYNTNFLIWHRLAMNYDTCMY